MHGLRALGALRSPARAQLSTFAGGILRTRVDEEFRSDRRVSTATTVRK
jgi:hypothetical protein